MCTAFTFHNDALYFGRNMDLEYEFGESVVITPRHYGIATKACGTISTHYAMMGMANVTSHYPLYAEAVNERGLCMAGLNFPGNARYLSKAEVTKQPVTPYELILYVLGTCATLAEARALLAKLDLVAIPFLPSLPLASLHWLISDASGSLTVEPTPSGLRVYENPHGVLTNNPPFPFHLDNVRQYLHLSAGSPENHFSPALPLTPFCQGAGAIGLPGDFSSASRFVKTLFCRENSHCDQTEAACVAQVFHILDAVALVRGTVITPEGKMGITTYSCCIDVKAGIYYYKTYENSQITKIQLTEERMEQRDLICFPLRKQPQFVTE